MDFCYLGFMVFIRRVYCYYVFNEFDNGIFLEVNNVIVMIRVRVLARLVLIKLVVGGVFFYLSIVNI